MQGDLSGEGLSTQGHLSDEGLSVEADANEGPLTEASSIIQDLDTRSMDTRSCRFQCNSNTDLDFGQYTYDGLELGDFTKPII